MPSGQAAKRRIKVAVLVGALEVGGVELDIVRNFPRLDRDEFDVVVVSFGTRGTLAPELERQGIRVVARKAERPETRRRPLGRMLRFLRSLLPTRPRKRAVGRARPGRYERFVRSLPVALRNACRPLTAALRNAGRALWRAIRSAGRTLKRGASTVRAWFLGLRAPAWLVRRLGPLPYIVQVTRWVGRTLNAENADIAHFFLPHAYAYGMFATALMRPRTKRVMSRVSLNFYKDTHKLIAWLERHLLHRTVDVAIGNSRMIVDELVKEGVDPERVRLLHNGIDPTPFGRSDDERRRARETLGIDRDAFVVVAVGNLHRYKGHGDLIEACAIAADRLPDRWRLLVAGRDEAGNRAVYGSLVEERGLGDHVEFLGPRDDVPRLLFAADVFAQPSHHEGLPNAVIEAMAASLPVIGTTVGGIPEAVRPAGDAAETGWLIPPHDPDALAAALLDAAADPDRRGRMGTSARERVEAEFSLEKSVAAYEAIYRALMPSARG